MFENYRKSLIFALIFSCYFCKWKHYLHLVIFKHREQHVDICKTQWMIDRKQSFVFSVIL